MGKIKSAIITVIVTLATLVLFLFGVVSCNLPDGVHRYNSILSNIHLGSELSGDSGRLVVVNNLTVTSGASATIASGLVASCNNLFLANATLTVNGKLYYGYVFSGDAPSGDVAQVFNAQLPYSDFDNWYEKPVTGRLLEIELSGLSLSVGITGSTSPWVSANDGAALLGYNPTTPEEEDTPVRGKGCKMASQAVPLTLLGLIPLPSRAASNNS